MSPPLWLIVPAAGRGRRMGTRRPKQYLPLAGRTVMQHTLMRLHAVMPDARLCLCLSPDDSDFDDSFVPFAHWHRIAGGDERVDSVTHALDWIATVEPDDQALVLVHDVARPCVRAEDLGRLLAHVAEDPVGGLLAAPVADTMKRADEAGGVMKTEERNGLWHAFTPQGFRLGALRDALCHARQQGIEVTDEASAVEAMGLTPRLVMGSRDNLKITHAEDLALAEQVLAAQASAPRSDNDWECR